MTIIDARNVAPGSTLGYDVCVIGGGPVGISAALTLSRLGVQVLLLESGDLTSLEAATTALANTDSVGQPIVGMFGGAVQVADFTERRLGGASNHFAGFCHAWKDEDYTDCPVSKAEMDPHYDDAHNFWAQGPVNYDPAYWGGVTGLSVPNFGPDLKFEVVQQRGQNFGAVYLQEIIDSTTLTLVHHANATNLNAAAGGGHINTITVQTLSGVMFYVQAADIVEAMGATQNARLALMSNDVVSAGVGNEYDQVGRYECDHSASGLAFAYLRTPPAELGLLVGAQNVATTTPDGRPTATNILPVLDMSTAASVALGYSMHWEMTVYDVSAYAAQNTGLGPTRVKEFMQAQGGAPQVQLIFRTFLKQLGNPESRVQLNLSRLDAFGRPEPKLNRQSLATDSTNRQAAMRYMAGLLDMSGKGLVQNTLNWAIPSHYDPTKPIPAWFEIYPSGDEPNSYHETCFHNMCTTRMGMDPATSVVDPNCKVHTVDNLYMAGPSVFHAGVGYYPTLPAIAFAVRLAKHLYQKRGGGALASRQAANSANRTLGVTTPPQAVPTPQPGPMTQHEVEALVNALASGTVKDPWAELVRLGLQQPHPASAITTTTAAALPLVGGYLLSRGDKSHPSSLGSQQPTSPARANYGRREFMGKMAKGAAVLALVGGSATLLTSCVANPWNEIIAMGQQYSAKVPAESDYATLKTLLGNPADSNNPVTLLKNLKPMINADYASGKVFVITGWCLSLTEWRICAWWATHPAPTTTTTTTA